MQAFIELLPSFLDSLSAPRLALRVQAYHPFGGLAFVASQIPLSDIHTRPTETVAAALTVAPASSLISSPSTPWCGGSMLIKTLRTTLAGYDPSCSALCTLVVFIVLHSPALVTYNGIKELLALSVYHKSSVATGVFPAAPPAYERGQSTNGRGGRRRKRRGGKTSGSSSRRWSTWALA